MDIDIIREIKKIIYKSKLKNTYYHKHPNTKYRIELIIKELIYVLKTGISWNNLRSPINSKTLYWHFKNFIKYHIFNRLFDTSKNKFFKINK